MSPSEAEVPPSRNGRGEPLAPERIAGGGARRAMPARVLATEPEVLLLDEPTADLDPAAAPASMRLPRETANAGPVVVAAPHAIELAVRDAARMPVMHAGGIIADATPEAALLAAATAFGLRLGHDLAPRLLPRDDDAVRS
jgi:ABC-type cobalamin/Fe3+-siderophores transport system ATPase subunit